MQVANDYEQLHFVAMGSREKEIGDPELLELFVIAGLKDDAFIWQSVS